MKNFGPYHPKLHVHVPGIGHAAIHVHVHVYTDTVGYNVG